MLKTSKKETLADKISNILSTTPASFDPDEEEVAVETAAKVTEADPHDSDEDDLVVPPGKFRKQNVQLLEDVDVKYAGKRSSRKDLKDTDDDDSVSDVEPSDESEDESTVSSATTAEEESDVAATEETDFKHVRDSDVDAEVKKGLCVRNQLNLWESLLEARIQLQKCLVAANKMPRPHTFEDIKAATPGPIFADKVAETRTSIATVLDKLLQLQTLLQKRYPETKALFTSDAPTKANDDDDDEEIPSDTDDEPDVSESAVPMKRRRLENYGELISTNHQGYRNYRNSVIQKWYDKTRVGVVAKKNNPTHSVLDQIEYHLSDRDKLRKRTRTKRSEYTIVGREETEAGGDEDAETFDDSDFYHQLLRELIEVKSADVTDPVQLGRQWVQLQNLRSKMKRKVDTKATKGRKVRYTVHSKLVNFMAPIDENAWTDEAKTELFGSLFGGGVRET